MTQESDVPEREPRKVSLTVTLPRRVCDSLTKYCQENNVLRSVALQRLIEHALDCEHMESLGEWL